MKNYVQAANILEQNPVDLKVLNKDEFKLLTEKRHLKYSFTIDTVEGYAREVWGNRNFEIIVKHDLTLQEYIIL